MYKKLKVGICLAALFVLSSQTVLAGPMDVLNPSFEYSGAVDIDVKTMDIIPDNWSYAIATPGVPNTTGLEGTGSSGVEGEPQEDYVCVVLYNTDSIYQLLDYTIAEGDEYDLRFDAYYLWTIGAPYDCTFQGRLYYDDPCDPCDPRTVIDYVEDNLSGAGFPDGIWYGYILNTTIPPGHPAIGNKLGIELTTEQATGGGGSWFGFDSVSFDTTIYVDTAASGAKDGTTWANAFNYLQDALAVAEAEDKIWVAEGTYKPDEFDDPNYVPGDRTDTFQLINDVAVYGGFPSGGGTWQQRDPNRYETILSGDLNEDDGPGQWEDYAENSYHVVTGLAIIPSTILDGFTITAGNANGVDPSNKGGGMYNFSGFQTVNNCTFSANLADFGGGIANMRSDPALNACVFNDNRATSEGGGIHNDRGGPTGYSRPTLVDCIFFNNSSVDGGGVFNDLGSGLGNSPTLINCIFIGNDTDPCGNGGGMYSSSLSRPTLVNCAFSGNTSNGGMGGGMYILGGASPTLTNCTFSGNSAMGAGGMLNAGNTTLDNCIFWGNNDNGGTGELAQITNSGTLTIDYSCVQNWSGGFGGTGNIGDDPCFVDADGPDDIAGTEDDNLRLSYGSGCIDAGDNTAVPADTVDLDGDGNTSEPIPLDLDGNLRFINDVDVANTGNGTGPIVDMGAYEALTYTAYVDDDGPGDPWPGDPNDSDPLEDGSQDHPFDAIGEAIDVIAVGGVITVLEGTYSGFGNRDIDFGGKAFTLTSTDPEDPCVVAATIIDANGTEEYPHRGFYFHSAEDANSIIDGFTITNGYYEEGGGILCESSSPTLTNCIFRENMAWAGGGIYNFNSNSVLINCTFRNNFAGDEEGSNEYGDGGGVFNTGSSLVLTNCTFIGNVALGGGGGGMCSWDGDSSTLTNCTFSNNVASHDGGAMHIGGSSPALTNCTFTGNSVGADVVWGGGAIFKWTDSNPTLTNCAFSGNRSPLYGGAIYSRNGINSAITNCTFSGNTADVAGGAIYCSDSRAFIAQSVSEFSDSQGQDNWQYGYYDGGDPCNPWTNNDFEQLPLYGPSGYGFNSWSIENYWTSLWSEGGHPNGQLTSGEATEAEHWAVRRWISDVDGTVRITGNLAKTNPDGGEGIIGHIIADGAEEWSQYIEYNDSDGVQYGIDVDVSIGSLVDFAIDPNYSDVYDGTRFTANIAERPPTDYLEIKNCILWDNTAPEGPQVGLEESDVRFTYCDLQGGPAAIYEANSVVDWGDGNIGTDPMFVRDPCDGGDGWGDDPCTPGTDEGANDDYGDLHLQGPSPCIDTGDPIGDYSDQNDIDGELRVINGRIDMGADEFLDSDSDNIADYQEKLWGLDPDDDDMDDDGLLDGIEACYDGDCFTYNPYNPATGLGGDLNAESDDTDEDIMSDSWESQYWDIISPINEQDAYKDPDGDRYMNFEEFIRGTVPNNPSSKPTPLTFYVDNDALFDPFPNNPDISDPWEDGSSEHPFDAIQEAIDIAVSWDTVIVLTGTYTGLGNRDIDFNRRRTTLTSTAPENASVVAATIIDCEADPCEPHRGFYFHTSEDANSVLAGFTITNGYAPEMESPWGLDLLGGGIYCTSSSPTINNCTFSGNTANSGGGMWNEDESSPTLTNCIFSNNTAIFYGSGMYNYASDPKLSNCTFRDNSAVSGGGISNAYNSPTLINCTFRGNRADDWGGGMCNGISAPTLTNCTFLGNSAEFGGGLQNFGNSNPKITNCTFIDNQAAHGRTLACNLWQQLADPSTIQISNSILWNGLDEISNNDGSTITITYSNVQGGWPGVGNIDKDPNLTPNPHLRAGSPCIDAGDPCFVIDPCAPYDIDGENRIINGRVDIGADEFLDTDADGMPDFWEDLHFESATDPCASEDPDNDGLTNLQEYELYSSDPNADPIYVDVDNAADPFQDGNSDHPFDTIQEGLDAADDGDTVLVADGNYTGPGNKELDFAGKSIVLRSISGAPSTTIGCEGSGRAFNFDDGETAGAAVIGFTITGGNAAYGGAIRCYHSHPQFRDCIITSNTATERGGGVYSTYSTLTFADCSIIGNEPNGIWAEYGGAKIFGDVELRTNDWVGNNLMLTGDGTIKLYSGAKMDLADSEIRCNIAGMYDIIVEIGEELTVSGEATIDLLDLDPAKSNPNYGTLDCKGKLKVKDKAKVIHANIYITQASIEDEAELSSNFIEVYPLAPYGQFYVDKKAKVHDNEIHTDGDRIMNLDPEASQYLIANNEIHMTITEGMGGTRAGLVELRGNPDFADGSCDPNSFFCRLDTVPEFDPNTWTLEELIFLPGAKANLTNLVDFQKPYDEDGAYEVLYVKSLILGEDAVLNTAFNRIYYEDLDGDPNCFKNEPLLGFSLINIALDDDIEFLVRVAHNNYVHPTDPNLNLIYVERVEGLEPDPAGMMRMKNIGSIDARAKGLFAKAGEDDVLVRFEYLFETPDQDVELVIYLSDVPELLSHNDPCRANRYLEVGRVYNPLDGQMGSVSRDSFGVFHEYVPTGNLDFIKGLRVELELIGPDGASVLINNWDPQFDCSGVVCKDVDGENGVTVVDFLTVIGEYGETAELLEDGTSSLACLDGIFSDDGYVDSGDVTSWDWVLNSLEDRKNLCDSDDVPLTDDPAKSGGMATASVPLPGPFEYEGALLIAGKMYDSGQTNTWLKFMTDRLYGYDEQGGFIDQFAPAYERANGKLVQDSDGKVYQLNLEQGLVWLGSEPPQVVVPPGQESISGALEPRYSVSAEVYIGLHGTAEQPWGRPILDAAFDSDGFLYVVPVVVDPNGYEPYTAAAMLGLLGGGNYQVLQLYDDPNAASQNDNRNLNGLREIEADDYGYVYVANVHSINESDILWVYDADTGQMEKRLTFSHDPNDSSYLPAPIGMHVSNTTGMLYLASSQNSAGSDSTSVYAISTEELIQSQENPNILTIDINGMGHITDMTHDPATGTLWVVGFEMDIPQDIEPTKPSFYHPYIAHIPYESGGPVDANCLSDSVPGPENSLALPMSIVWTGTAKCGGVDLDGDGIVNLVDFAFFTSHWLESGCVFHAWCEGTDLDPAFLDRGDVNVTDLSIFAQYWLDTCTYPE